MDQGRDDHPAPPALTDADWYGIAAGRVVLGAAEGVGRFGLHLVFGVDGCTDDCATPPAAACAERNWITGRRGVLGTAEGIAGCVLRCCAGFEPTGLGAEHLDDSAGDHTHA